MTAIELLGLVSAGAGAIWILTERLHHIHSTADERIDKLEKTQAKIERSLDYVERELATLRVNNVSIHREIVEIGKSLAKCQNIPKDKS